MMVWVVNGRLGKLQSREPFWGAMQGEGGPIPYKPGVAVGRPYCEAFGPESIPVPDGSSSRNGGDTNYLLRILQQACY